VGKHPRWALSSKLRSRNIPEQIIANPQILTIPSRHPEYYIMAGNSEKNRKLVTFDKIARRDKKIKATFEGGVLMTLEKT
jgi:hypothetical protein